MTTGDAAHIMTPTQSQGANQAIEDAEGLVLLNDDAVNPDNLHVVLAQWVCVALFRDPIKLACI
jgi:salicylate hydroxylase